MTPRYTAHRAALIYTALHCTARRTALICEVHYSVARRGALLLPGIAMCGISRRRYVLDTQHCITLQCPALHYTTVYCTSLQLQCTALHYTAVAVYYTASDYPARQCSPFLAKCNHRSLATLHRQRGWTDTAPAKHCTALYALHCTAQHCTTLHHTALHCTALYCTHSTATLYITLH